MEARTQRSRRDLLRAATAGVAAAGVAVLATPLTAAAASSVDIDADNAGTGITRVKSDHSSSGHVAFMGRSLASNVGVYGFSGASGNLPVDPGAAEFGVYGRGSSDTSAGVVGTGVVSGTDASLGFSGSGNTGMYGTGTYGVVGDVNSVSIGVYGFTGDSNIPSLPAGIGVAASAETTGQVALHVYGRAIFSRSGRATVAAGKSSVKVTLGGVKAANLVFAVLAKNTASRYVRACVAANGSLTIYLNASVSASTGVNWIVFG